MTYHIVCVLIIMWNNISCTYIYNKHLYGAYWACGIHMCCTYMSWCIYCVLTNSKILSPYQELLTAIALNCVILYNIMGRWYHTAQAKNTHWSHALTFNFVLELAKACRHRRAQTDVTVHAYLYTYPRMHIGQDNTSIPCTCTLNVNARTCMYT